MRIRVEDVNKTRKNVMVSVEASEIDRAQNRVVGQFSREVRIPGFRPGKAPANIVLRRFGRDVAEQLERKIKADAFEEIVEDGRLKVCEVVALEPGVIKAGQPAEITFLVDVEPEITLPEYKGITVTVPAAEVTDEEVEGVLYRVRSSRADFREKTAPAEESDYLQVSYEGTLEGRPLEEIVPDHPLLTRQSMTWEEASAENADFPGLAEQLIGLSAGEEKEITVDFAEDYEVEALMGKSVQYAVRVAEVREKVLPEIDEDFLQLHQVESVEELKESFRAELTVSKENERRRMIREQILNFLAENTAFDLPQSEVDDEREFLLQAMRERGWNDQEAEDDPEAVEAGLREDAAKEARRRVKTNWVLRKIAEIERIQPEERDYQKFIIMEAMQTRQRPETIAKALHKDPARRRAIQESMLFNKTLAFLMEQSTVAENQEL